MMDLEKKRLINKRTKKRGFRKHFGWLLITILVAIALVGIFSVNVSPIRAFGGAFWLEHGIHYMTGTQITSRIKQLTAPTEAAAEEKIISSTRSCDSIEEGFCERSPGDFAFKTLVSPAVAYKAGTPDTKVVVGYCTLCWDGSWSPSCAVGRGACSWHSGVQAYNVAEYKTIPGIPAVEAQPAVYSYASKSYQDSTLYEKPQTPSLKTIVGIN